MKCSPSFDHWRSSVGASMSGRSALWLRRQVSGHCLHSFGVVDLELCTPPYEPSSASKLTPGERRHRDDHVVTVLIVDQARQQQSSKSDRRHDKGRETPQRVQDALYFVEEGWRVVGFAHVVGKPFSNFGLKSSVSDSCRFFFLSPVFQTVSTWLVRRN